MGLFGRNKNKDKEAKKASEKAKDVKDTAQDKLGDVKGKAEEVKDSVATNDTDSHGNDSRGVDTEGKDGKEGKDNPESGSATPVGSDDSFLDIDLMGYDPADSYVDKDEEDFTESDKSNNSKSRKDKKGAKGKAGRDNKASDNKVNTVDNADNDEDTVIHGNLEEAVVDAVGFGSEDVKNIVVTTKDGKQVTFTVSAGVIKNVSTESDYHISNRLNWVDSNVISDEVVEKVEEIFSKEDFFDALNDTYLTLAEEDEDVAIEVTNLISDTYAERSIKNLVLYANSPVKNVETDWTLDSDTDIIEAYNGFKLDPATIDFTVDSIATTTDERFQELGRDSKLYVTDTTAEYYSNPDNEDVDRYTIGALLYTAQEDFAEGETPYVYLSQLVEYSDGFRIVDVFDSVEKLVEAGAMSFTDPGVVPEIEPEEEPEPEPVVEPEPEPIEEPEDFGDELDMDEDDYANYEEELEDEDTEEVDEDTNDYYPSAIPGGTECLGGPLPVLISQLRDSGVLTRSDNTRLEYAETYNTLYEQSVQGVELTLSYAVTELKRSKKVYGSVESLGNQNVDTVSKTSNLYKSSYLLESERDELNRSRTKMLRELDTIVRNAYENGSDIPEVTVTQIFTELDNKLAAIDNVEEVVTGEKSSLYIAPESTVVTEENAPLFFQIAREHGLEL